MNVNVAQERKSILFAKVIAVGISLEGLSWSSMAYTLAMLRPRDWTEMTWVLLWTVILCTIGPDRSEVNKAQGKRYLLYVVKKLPES